MKDPQIISDLRRRIAQVEVEFEKHHGSKPTFLLVAPYIAQAIFEEVIEDKPIFEGLFVLVDPMAIEPMLGNAEWVPEGETPGPRVLH